MKKQAGPKAPGTIWHPKIVTLKVIGDNGRWETITKTTQEAKEILKVVEEENLDGIWVFAGGGKNYYTIRELKKSARSGAFFASTEKQAKGEYDKLEENIEVVLDGLDTVVNELKSIAQLHYRNKHIKTFRRYDNLWRNVSKVQKDYLKEFHGIIDVMPDPHELEWGKAASERTSANLSSRLSTLRQYQDARDALVERLKAKNKTEQLNKRQERGIANGQAMQKVGEWFVSEFIDDYNDIKKKLDVAYEAKKLEDFEDALKELKDFSRKKELMKQMTVAQRNRTIFKVDSNLRKELVDAKDHVVNALTNGAKWLKRQRMSEKQRGNADSQSRRMREHWRE